MFSPKFEWNDFFIGTPATTIGPGLYSSREAPSTSSVYVSNCLFNNCFLSSGDGGALYCSSATYFFVESSSFFTCKANNGYGGAIYFDNSNCLQSFLYSVCGYDCSATSYGIFARININNAATSKNYVNYSSVVRCVSDISNSQRMLNINYGKIYFPSVNTSMNKCTYFSGILYSPFVDSNTFTSLLSYCTFVDNRASEHGCIWCNNGGAKYEIKCCNILRNTGTYGIIFARGNLMIEYSCILENTATYIFYQEQSSYTITISNCTVDSNKKYGNVVTQNTVTKSFILGLNHMITRNCHSEYDSAGYLTAIPCISTHSSSKRVSLCTCGMFHYQVKISDFFTLNWVFIVPFIHPNPSRYF
jgi:hypothetical protein